MNLTFCLMTCGEETEAECLQAIESFRDKIVFAEVRNVTPQIKALNQMIDLVQTEFFIPLDADMILAHNAYTRIRNALKENVADPTWHSILFPLWDTLTQRKILALKLLRTSVMKAHPFVESATPDVEHYQRLTANGFTCVHKYLDTPPIGDHVVRGHHYCYHKYRDVYLTYRSHNFEWDSGAFMGGDDLVTRSKRHYDYFLSRWVETGNDDCLSCIAGMYDGIISELSNKSKDLGSKAYLVPNKEAAGLYMAWYLANCGRFQQVVTDANSGAGIF